MLLEVPDHLVLVVELTPNGRRRVLRLLFPFEVTVGMVVLDLRKRWMGARFYLRISKRKKSLRGGKGKQPSPTAC